MRSFLEQTIVIIILTVGLLALPWVKGWVWWQYRLPAGVKK